MQKLRKSKLIYILSILLVAICSTYLIYDYCNKKKLETLEDYSVQYFLEEEIIVEENQVDEETVSTSDNTVVYNYSMLLEIPSINLTKGLYHINSYYNSVSYNVEINSSSSMPNEENSTLILASHSGNSSVSYFKNLNQLVIDDLVYIYYENIKYTYEIVEMYEIEKLGYMYIENTSIDQIYLVTCKTGTDKQIVVRALLINEENFKEV